MNLRAVKFNSGTTIAIAVVLLYVGFELFAVHRVHYRTEPEYLHNMLVSARTVTKECEFDVSTLEARFDQTLQRVITRYQNKLKASNADLNDTEIERLIAEQTLQSEDAMKTVVQQKGCSDKEIKAHLQRFGIYARKSRG